MAASARPTIAKTAVAEDRDREKTRARIAANPGQHAARSRDQPEHVGRLVGRVQVNAGDRAGIIDSDPNQRIREQAERNMNKKMAAIDANRRAQQEKASRAEQARRTSHQVLERATRPASSSSA